MPRQILFILTLALGLNLAWAGEGIPHRWSNASKEAVGTAFGYDSSPVWFTVQSGILTEVYSPRVDRAQIGDNQLLLVVSKDKEKFFLEEKRDFHYRVSHPAAVPRAIIKSFYDNGSIRISFTKEIVTDPDTAALRVRYRFQELPEGTSLYLLHKPAADNDAFSDVARVTRSRRDRTAIVAWDRESRGTAQALLAKQPILQASVGYVGENDGWQDLNRHRRLVNLAQENGPGNIAITAEFRREPELEFAIGFGPSPDEALASATRSIDGLGFDALLAKFDAGWLRYSRRLARTDWVESLPEKYKANALWNAAVIKAHEDKKFRGAIVASLSIPDLPGAVGQPDGKNTGGYHLVWTRDLFKAATALLKMGDLETAGNALEAMRRSEIFNAARDQTRISQNTWVDGRPFWTGTQLDQEAFPLLLAASLKKAGVSFDDDMSAFLKRRLDNLRRSTGSTGQERWEEVSGFSPNTLAVIAAAFSKVGDEENAKRIVEITLDKTVAKHGPLSRNPYFIRIAQTGEPDAGKILHIANGGPSLPEYRVLDGGFLEWVRWFPSPKNRFGELGTRLAQAIGNTLRLYDNPDFGVALPGSVPLFRRYTSDAYGRSRIGGPWPILSLERALPDLLNDPKSGPLYLKAALENLGPGDLCPEQLENGRPMPHAASPLVWCHAELIDLMHRTANLL